MSVSWRRLLERLPPLTLLGPSVALVLACVFFALQTGRFLSGQNFSLIVQQVMVVGVVAIGQTFVILTAGIDLACGMIMPFGGMVMTALAAELGIEPQVASACGLAVSVAFGMLNGLLVTMIRLPPFIVPLGTLNIAFAITQIYSESQTVSDLPEPLVYLGNTFHLGQTA